MLVEDGEGMAAGAEEREDRLEVGFDAASESKLAGGDYQAHAEIPPDLDARVEGETGVG
jgi:hypothetical protein